MLYMCQGVYRAGEVHGGRRRAQTAWYVFCCQNCGSVGTPVLRQAVFCQTGHDRFPRRSCQAGQIGRRWPVGGGACSGSRGHTHTGRGGLSFRQVCSIHCPCHAVRRAWSPPLTLVMITLTSLQLANFTLARVYSSRLARASSPARLSSSPHCRSSRSCRSPQQ